MLDTLKRLPDPVGMKKQDIVDMLLREEYGYLPERPYSVTAIERTEQKFCMGKAVLEKIILNCKSDFGEFSFPIYYAYPKHKTNVPCFIHINFRDLVPDRYQPTEELIDLGYATLTFCYKDITSDSGDFTDGLAGVVYPDGARKDTDCGKIGLWAWAAMAVMDFAQTLPELDKNRISVAGHSRLGKTALLAGALDERFYCAFSNDSGNSGAALARDSDQETIAMITKQFPFWFCENYKKYANREDEMPFDQHWLIAANVPHKVYVASAVDDPWACPKNENMACIAGSEYYKSYGMKGFVSPNRLAEVGECFHEGDIGYHLRAWGHFFSREDWLKYVEFLELKFK